MAEAAAPPPTKVWLTFKDICYSVPKKEDGQQTTHMILDHITGYAGGTGILGIMGPSGCGKTTLLDFLADRLSSGTREGTILVNGKPTGRSFKHYAAYVQQEDSLNGSLSVRETLAFAVAIASDKAEDNERVAMVDGILKQLGLQDCAENKIGTVFYKGISGGQKRRVSIGLSLVTDPDLLFLDEPTSGLDSLSALKVVELLHEMVMSGKTVVCTIHQPSSEVFHNIGTLMLLSRGKQIFFGPSEEALHFFEQNNYPCPTYTNPSDHFLQVINTDFEGHADIQELSNSFKETRGESLKPPVQVESLKDPESDRRSWASSYSEQFVLLSKRNLKTFALDPGLIWVRLVMYAMLSFMIGTMYVNIDNDDKAVQDRISLLFYVAAFMAFMSIAVLPFFLLEREVFIRERRSGWYPVSVYVLSYSLCALPGIFLIALVSSIIIYFPVGLHDGRFQWFLCDLFLTLVVAEGFVMAFSVIIPIFILCMALVAGFFGMFMLCEGFFAIPSNIPPWWIWGYYIAFHTYSFRTFMWAEFDSLELDAKNWGSGDDVLAYYDMEDANPWADMVVLLAMAIIYRLIFYGVLSIFHTGRR